MMTINRTYWLLAGILFALAVGILLAMERPPICSCGYIKFWEGEVNGPGNSQHLADWYTFSHIIHGFLFYALGWWLLRTRPLGDRMLVAIALELAWEIAENSPAVIDRYRQATLAVGYSGDAIINSLADGGWMLLGFMLAARLPWWVTAVVAILFELFTLIMIRDNLTLNVLMLLAPVEAIKGWQAA
jgi:hypothetical protein